MKLHTPVSSSSDSSRRTRGSGTLGTRRTVTHLVEDLYTRELAEATSVGELPVRVTRAGARLSPRILLVNADPLALERINARLAGEGYRVIAVSSFQYAKQAM